MTIQAEYYSTVAIDSLRGIHADSSNPVYKLAFMHPKFKYNPRHERWDQIDYREISPSGEPSLLKEPPVYPRGGYVIEVAATMIDGKFRLYPRNQSSITTLINYGFQLGWQFKSLVIYESKSGALVFAFDAVEAISGDYGGRFLKPRYIESKEIWNAGPPLVGSDVSTGTTGPDEFLSALALPPYVYDGEVRSIIPGDNNSYYLAGTFTQIAEGRYAGRGAFDYVDPVLGNDRPERFRVTGGSVFSILGDNQGGFFLLGDFTKAGKWEKKCICKYGPDFNVENYWGVNVNINGTLLTGALTEQFLYVGGSFTISYNSKIYRNLVRFNAETGALDPDWNPSPNSTVRTLKIHNEVGEEEFNTAANKLLYIGGSFLTIKSKDPTDIDYTIYQQKYLARYNMGEFEDPPEIDTSWGPTPNLSVHTIELDENYVYVGGAFTTAAGIARRRIFRARHKINLSNNAYRGLDTSWYANWGTGVLNNNNFVRSFVLHGDYVFISAKSDLLCEPNPNIKTLGAFSTLFPNQVLNFFPQFENRLSKSQIFEMKIFDNKLYCVGTFQKVNGQERGGAVAFDLSGNVPTMTQWAPRLNRPGPGTSGELGVSMKQLEPGLPGAFCIYPTFRGVFFGGNDLTPVQPRFGLCKINSDGKIDNWNPAIYDSTPNFNALARYEGFIYAGFSFDKSAPSLSNHSLVRISEETGEFSISWLVGDPSIGLIDISPSIIGNVFILKTYGDKLYAGFSGSVLGHNYIARFTLGETVTLDDWDPLVAYKSGGFVNYIDINDDNVYISGNFDQVGGFLREGFAVINPENAQTKSVIANFSPAVNSIFPRPNSANSGIINRFPLSQNSDGVYAVGSFTSVKRGPSVVLQGISSETYDNILSLNVNGAIRTIITDGLGGFYLAGTFTSILGKTRLRIAHINSQLQLTDWNPQLNGAVDKIFLRDNKLYVVGQFTKINGIVRYRAARFNTVTGALDPFVTNFSSRVYCVIADDNWVYYGLNDVYYANSRAKLHTLNGKNIGRWRGLVRVSLSTGLQDPNWIFRIRSITGRDYPVGQIYDMDLSDERLYVCGFYQRVWDFNSPLADKWTSTYSNATCISAPVNSGPASIFSWTVPIPSHPRKSNGKYITPTNWTSIKWRTLNSIKVHGDYVYIGGAPFRWGNRLPNGQRFRSSRIVRFPVNQGANLGIPDTDFKIRYSSRPNDIVSIMNWNSAEHMNVVATHIYFDDNEDIHLSTKGSQIGVLNYLTNNYSYQNFDGYVKIDSQTGAIKSFFSDRAYAPVHCSLVLPQDRLVVGSIDPTAWDLRTSMVQIGEDGKLSKIYPDPDISEASGTIDKKLELLKVENWLYTISEQKFDNRRSDLYFRAVDLNLGTDPVPQKKKLISSGKNAAKTMAKIGNYIVIVGGEMPREQNADDSTVWGDFVDHGAPGGRKVIYYKITESIQNEEI